MERELRNGRNEQVPLTPEEIDTCLKFLYKLAA
jgi:hypothetical protein